jgi:adenosylcobinamide-GDP ribazoletransferase
MVRRVTGFLGAVQFLTRVPIRLSAPVDHANAVPWFPAVGALIGLIVGGTAAGLAEVVPAAVAAACAVVVGLLVTGAFHEDGLADVADAFGGGWTVEQRLEIIKDSRHGTYGVTALIASIVVRVAAATSIAGSAALVVSFLAAHTLGRASAVGAMMSAPPAVATGLGVDAARSLRTGPAVVGIASAVGITAVATGWWTLPFVAAALLGGSAVVALAIRKIGGVAGDVLGAVEQVVECLVMVVASGLAARHGLWWR